MKRVPLKLYLAARWGNKEEGPNGADTLFLVRAPSCEAAADVADSVLAGLRETGIEPVSNWVCEIGYDSSGEITPAVLKGPFLGLSGADGYLAVWTRESVQDAWVYQKPVIEAAKQFLKGK